MNNRFVAYRLVFVAETRRKTRSAKSRFFAYVGRLHSGRMEEFQRSEKLIVHLPHKFLFETPPAFRALRCPNQTAWMVAKNKME
jgi:hypothetical protein